MKTTLIFLFFGILILMIIVTAQDEYINEFNEPSESASFDSTWDYLTSDGVQRKVQIYKYCISECVLVAFDIQNKITLDDEKNKDFFQNYKFKEGVNNNRINETLYTINFGNSLTCELIVPRFSKEAQNLAIQASSEKIAPEILPKNAAKFVSAAYQTGKDFGVVSKTNVPLLIVGALCIGSDLVKNPAASTLSSCKTYIINLRENKAYQGQAEDLINCHSEAISKLEITSKTPDIVIQHLETQGRNTITGVVTAVENLPCTIRKIFSQDCNSKTVEPEKSTHDKLISQIQELKKIKPDMNSINNGAELLAENSAKRISQKFIESEEVIKNLTEEINKANNDKKHEWGVFDYLWALNFFYTPGFDYSSAENYLSLADKNLNDSKQLQNQYKYNSAKITATEGIKYADIALSEISTTNNKPRTVKDKIIFIVIVVIVIMCVLVILYYNNK